MKLTEEGRAEVESNRRVEEMSGVTQIRIFSVDDHPLLHEGLATVIRHQSDMVLVAEASNGREAIQQFREQTPDVTLMDLRLPDMSGIDAMIAIRSEFPEARIIILTTFAGDAEIQRALEAGARAYLLKSMPPRELMDTIRQVHAGKKRIPPEIAAHLAERYSDEALAAPEVKKPLRTQEGVNPSGNLDSRSSEGPLQRWVSALFGRKRS